MGKQESNINPDDAIRFAESLLMRTSTLDTGDIMSSTCALLGIPEQSEVIKLGGDGFYDYNKRIVDGESNSPEGRRAVNGFIHGLRDTIEIEGLNRMTSNEFHDFYSQNAEEFKNSRQRKDIVTPNFTLLHVLAHTNRLIMAASYFTEMGRKRPKTLPWYNKFKEKIGDVLTTLE